MDPQADAALWTLLGRQETPGQAGPYFSRRVLHGVALAEETRAGGWGAWWCRIVPPALLSRQTVVWSGACAVGLCCLTLGTKAPKFFPALYGSEPGATRTPAAAVRPPAEAEATGVKADDDLVPVQEREVIADLDNAVQREESRLWTDENSTARF